MFIGIITRHYLAGMIEDSWRFSLHICKTIQMCPCLYQKVCFSLQILHIGMTERKMLRNVTLKSDVFNVVTL